MLKAIIYFIRPIRRLFLPSLIICLLYITYRMICKKDKAAGMALFIGIIIIVDRYMQAGISIIPGLNQGRLYYSEVVWIILFFQDKAFRKNLNYTFTKKIIKLFYIYLFIFFLPVFRSPAFFEGLIHFRRDILPQLLIFLISVTGLHDDEEYKRFFHYLLIIVAILGAFLLWRKFLDIAIIKSASLSKTTFYRAFSHGRYGSMFGNPNGLAEFVILLIPIYIILFLEESQNKAIYSTAIIFLFFLISQTQSRGAILAGFISILVLFFLYQKKTKIFFKLLLIILLLIAVMPGFFPRTLERFTEIEEELSTSKISRYNTAIQTLRLIKDHPWGIGYGEDNYMAYVIPYAEDQELIIDNPHNSYLYIMVVGGIQAGIISLIFFGKIFFYILKAILRKRDILLLGFFCGINAFLVAILFSPSFFVVSVYVTFWVFLGLSISILQKNENLVNQT